MAIKIIFYSRNPDKKICLQLTPKYIRSTADINFQLFDHEISFSKLTHPANSFLLHPHLSVRLVCSFTCLSLQEWTCPNEERDFEWTMVVYLMRIFLIYTVLTFSAWPYIRILACPFRMHFRKKVISHFLTQKCVVFCFIPMSSTVYWKYFKIAKSHIQK